MDYENVKAVILAVLKKWQERPMTTEVPERPSMISVDLASSQIVTHFCQDILEQLKTSFDIWEAQ